MTTRTNEQLESAYASGNSTNHHEGLRAVYQLGRTDEVEAMARALAPKPDPEPSSELVDRDLSQLPNGTSIPLQPLDSPVTATEDQEPAKAAE